MSSWFRPAPPMSSSTISRHDRFTAFAPGFDRWEGAHPSVAKQRHALLRPLRGRILEVGVGTGIDLPCYRQGADVTACDISWRMLQQAVFRLSKMGGHRIKLVKMDARRLLFLDGTFDAVVGMFLLCSVEQPGKAAREIRRVLKPGGRFVALDYHAGRAMLILRRAGLAIVSTKEWPSGDHLIGQIIAERATLVNLRTAHRPGRVEASPDISVLQKMKTNGRNQRPKPQR